MKDRIMAWLSIIFFAAALRPIELLPVRSFIVCEKSLRCCFVTFTPDFFDPGYFS